MKKQITLSVLCFSIMLLTGFLTSAAAATRTVDRLDDPTSVQNFCTAAANDCSMRGAIEYAASGDTINFSPTLYGQTISLQGAIDIYFANLNIQGPGANLITVKSNFRYIISQGDINGTQLSGLRFADSAGGVFVLRHTMTISNMIFDNIRWVNATAVETHALVVDDLATVTVNGCTFTNNSTGVSGGIPGPSRSGGAIRNSGRLTINGSYFSGNSASDMGGAIYNEENGNTPPSSVTINNSGITNNTANRGGAIYNDVGNILIINSTISNNSADRGGGIRNRNVATIINSAFLDNSSANLDVNSGGGGISSESGGGINGTYLATLNVMNSTFSGNHTNGRGGAIHSQTGTVFLRHLTITNNVAGVEGGIGMQSSAYTLANSIITDNTASGLPNTASAGSNNIIGGPALLRPLGDYDGPTWTRPPYCGSPAIDAGNNGLSTDQNSSPLATDQRGMLRNSGVTVDIGAVEAGDTHVSNISDNVLDAGSLRKAIADAPAGGMICFDPAFFSTPRIISMNGSAFLVDKSLTIDGPGMDRLTLDANLASRNFYLSPASARRVRISGLTLIHGKSNVSEPDLGSGGGIFVGGSLSDSSGVLFIGTNLVVSGGSAGIGGGIYNRGVLDLTDSTVTGNDGSGISNDPGKWASLTRATVTNNTAVQGAGIINLGNMTITDSTVRFNVAAHPVGQSGSPPLGGGIFNGAPGSLTLGRSLIANNTSQLGGGLYNTGYSELKNVTFTSNQALTAGDGTGDGGAIYAGGNYVGTKMATIDGYNLTVGGNFATSSGGGTYLKQVAGSFALQNLVNSLEAQNGAGSGPDISVDEAWTDVGTIREVYFPSLPAGDYTFHVIAANSDGVWNTEGARLKISVLARFWQTTWFFVLVSIAAVLIVLAVFRLRLKELERRQVVQQEFSRMLLASQEQERQRIAAELHDSIGQSLLIIKNRAFIALDELDQRDMVKEQLEELSASATEAIEECREISYNLRPYQIARFGLTRTLEAIFNRIAEVSETRTSVKLDQIDGLFSPEEEINIYRIVQESVNNIIKHSAAAEASMTIRHKGNNVKIVITDNGRGFDQNADSPAEDKRGGFGMIGIAERVRMLGGAHQIASQKGKGTSITISLTIS